MLQVWSLTELGRTMAHSIRSPRSSGWLIIHHLSNTGAQTTDQIANYINLGKGEVSAILLQLKRKMIVTEIGQVEVG